MSAPGVTGGPVDVLGVMDDAAHALNSVDYRIEREELLEARAAVAELIEAGKQVKRAIQFMDDVREAAARGEETIATGVYRDAVEWIEKAARQNVAALARVGGAG